MCLLLGVVCCCLSCVDVWCRCRRLLTLVSRVMLFDRRRLLLFVVMCSRCGPLAVFVVRR